MNNNIQYEKHKIIKNFYRSKDESGRNNGKIYSNCYSIIVYINY